MVLTLGGVPSKYKRATFHLIRTHWALLNLSWVACRAWWDESERERVFSSPFPTPTSPARSVTKRTWDNSAFSLFPRQRNVTSTSLKLLSLTSDPPILTPFWTCLFLLLDANFTTCPLLVQLHGYRRLSLVESFRPKELGEK